MILDDVIAKISEQQKGKEGTAVYGCGEQLKDICRKYPHAAELVLQDLSNKDMSIEACEKKIKARADEIHRKKGGNSAGVSPIEAEKIICKFYGIDTAAAAGNKTVSLADLI